MQLSNYQDGWVHVIITVNHSANQVKCYYDFVEQSPEYDRNGLTLTGTSLTSGSTLCIGQDALGHEQDHLPAYLDDVMIFNGVLTSSDVSALRTYYGK
ncbi:MAG: LamG domain-containing protein [Ruminococcaceae bacterium]|nr:LamG domain-containing protein [Oscillospiraceae bacterium]